MLADFAKGNRDASEAILGAVARGDIYLAHRLTHTIKSDAALIGKRRLQRAAAEVENMLSGGNNLLTDDAMRSFDEELKAALLELEPLLPEGQTPPAVSAESLDQASALALLDRVEPLLRSGNPQCLDLMGGLRRIPGSDELLRLMDNFDFEPAVTQLAALRRALEG